ncbi:argininosuccinate lyase [Streptomyces sp. CB02613]|uniref:lyase family protein n=1 Tax=Streptomyces sp. CB02613 TaxID=2020328 RepID=UPI000C2719B8|nr:lyase family protein [Streptomyces sp. CB02613]PJN27233.1 argininosuccinate lyase [Streptomyces sp. CB02613]
MSRLTATVGARVQSIVYGEPTPEEIDAELRLTTRIDLAHLVMLGDRKLIDAADAAALVGLIERLRAARFRPLHDAPTPRGLYLAYEQLLSAELGAGTGGRLHTGRSRNDLKATATALRLRAELTELVSELSRFQAVLLARARAHRDVIMPVHTHFQAAMPATYGYYLAGVAHALGRDIAALRRCGDELDRCPMGASAVAGTDLPIDPTRTARLLGFAGPARHAVDAVASRDTALRALAAAAGAALTISRIGTDLQLWSSAEFGFVAFPDRLVGGSSAMPQKRNAFLLEHVRAKAGAAIGAWTAAAATMRATPFTNSIEVGTEAVAAVWPGLRAVLEGTVLARALVGGGRPVPERMLARAEDGFVGATALANRLVRQGIPFRTAHEVVGGAVRRAVGRGAVRLAAEHLPAELSDTEISLPALVAEQRFGGGPGAFDPVFDSAYADLTGHADWLRAVREAQDAADRELAAGLAALTGSRTRSPGDGGVR